MAWRARCFELSPSRAPAGAHEGGSGTVTLLYCNWIGQILLARPWWVGVASFFFVASLEPGVSSAQPGSAFGDEPDERECAARERGESVLVVG